MSLCPRSPVRRPLLQSRKIARDRPELGGELSHDLRNGNAVTDHDVSRGELVSEDEGALGDRLVDDLERLTEPNASVLGCGGDALRLREREPMPDDRADVGGERRFAEMKPLEVVRPFARHGRGREPALAVLLEHVLENRPRLEQSDVAVLNDGHLAEWMKGEILRASQVFARELEGRELVRNAELLEQPDDAHR